MHVVGSGHTENLKTISRRCLGNTCRVFVTITGPLPTLSSCSSLILSKFTLCQFSSCNSTEAAFQGKNTVLCCEDDDCAPRNIWPSLRTLNTYTESKPPWTDQRLDICDACPSTCSPTARDFLWYVLLEMLINLSRLPRLLVHPQFRSSVSTSRSFVSFISLEPVESFDRCLACGYFDSTLYLNL